MIKSLPKWQNQERVPLTKEMIVEAAPHSILYEGQGYIEHPYFNQAKSVDEGGNLELDGRSVLVNYVVFRGGAPDWCIYHSLNSNLTPSRYLESPEHLEFSYQRVKSDGTKLHNEAQIKALVMLQEPDLLDMYRH